MGILALADYAGEYFSRKPSYVLSMIENGIGRSES